MLNLEYSFLGTGLFLVGSFLLSSGLGEGFGEDPEILEKLKLATKSFGP